MATAFNLSWRDGVPLPSERVYESSIQLTSKRQIEKGLSDQTGESPNQILGQDVLVDFNGDTNTTSPDSHRSNIPSNQRPSNANRNVSGFLPPAISVASKYGMVHSKQASPQEQADTKIYEFLQEVEKYLFAPDLEAVLVIMGFFGAYKMVMKNPLWIQLSGGSSAGKTTIAFDWMLSDLYEDHWSLSNLTPKTLISGYTKSANNKASLLNRIGSRGLLLFKDITNLLSQHEEVVKAVAGQFREIADGSVSNHYGTGQGVAWQGNVSILAGLTPEFERLWNLCQPGGERFVTLRYRSVSDNDLEIARRAMRTAGSDIEDTAKKRAMQARMRELVEFTDLSVPDKPRDEELDEWGLPELATVIARLRSIPTTEEGRGASYSLSTEVPGRISRQLMNCAMGLASIRRKERVTVEEAKLVRRLGMDTIPIQKRWILDVFLKDLMVRGKAVVIEGDLYQRTPFMKRDDFRVHLNDMRAVGVLEVNEGSWKLNEKFLKLLLTVFGRRL